MPQHRKPPDQTVVDLNSAYFVADMAIGYGLERCNLSWATWSRWKRQGVKPKQANLDAMYQALRELVAEREEREAAPGQAV